jgi:flagellar biosynthesis protein FlhF
MDHVLRSRGAGATTEDLYAEVKLALNSVLQAAPVPERKKTSRRGAEDNKAADAARPEAASPFIVAFVGPAGVGKTTALAKLAAHFAIRRARSVGLISIESSNPDSLGAYADQMGVPVRRVRTPAQLAEAVKELRDRVYIFIDTPACAARGSFAPQKLHAFLEAVPGIQTHLVLSATTRLRDLLAIADAFKPLFVDRLLFTKLDETATLGHLLGLLQETGLPVSYLSTGQEIPEDLEPASADRLVKRFLGEE